MPTAMIAPARPTARIAIARPGPTPSEPVVVNAGAIEASGDGLAAAALADPTADGSAAPAVVAGLAVANAVVEADGSGEDAGLDDADAEADAAGLPAGALEPDVAGIGWIET